jgi:hypothetical protein
MQLITSVVCCIYGLHKSTASIQDYVALSIYTFMAVTICKFP